jgi:hypothetical protein
MAGASEGAGGGGNKDDIAVVKLAMASAAIASIGVHQSLHAVKGACGHRPRAMIHARSIAHRH